MPKHDVVKPPVHKPEPKHETKPESLKEPTPIKPPPVPKPDVPKITTVVRDEDLVRPEERTPKPEPKPLVYCTECKHLRYTKQSVEMGFEPLCSAVAKPNQFIARSGPLSYEKCSVVNPHGHCQYYTQQTPPRPGFWTFAFGESQP